MTTETPRRMLQPRKDVLREQLALAAAEIIRLRERASRPPPFWHLALGAAAGCIGTLIGQVIA